MIKDKSIRTNKNAGFTLVELLVVMVLMAILAGIAIPSITSYQKHSRYQKNTEYARELFLDAQAGISSYKASGLSDRLEGQELLMIQQGDTSKADAQILKELLSTQIADEDFFHASMAIRIDPDTGVVLESYYYDGTMDLAEEEKPDALWMNNSDESYRREHALGYYSAE